jgi:hypothetical protein
MSLFLLKWIACIPPEAASLNTANLLQRGDIDLKCPRVLLTDNGNIAAIG